MRREPASSLPDPAAATPWADTLTAWVASLTSANTRTAYRADLLQFGRWCAERDALPLEVSMADVVAYQQAIGASGVSAATARRRSSSLSSFFEYAVASGVVASNPVTGTARPALPSASSTPVLDTDQLALVAGHAETLDPRAHALVALLAFDGLKLNEVLALDTDHVERTGDRLTATVERSGRSTPIPLDARSTEPVTACIADRASGPLFVNQRQERLSRFGADHLLKRLPAVDGTPLTANTLRRSFVATAQAAGLGIDEISARSGVDDIRTTQRYLLAPPGPTADGTTPASSGPTPAGST